MENTSKPSEHYGGKLLKRQDVPTFANMYRIEGDRYIAKRGNSPFPEDDENAHIPNADGMQIRDFHEKHGGDAVIDGQVVPLDIFMEYYADHL